MKVILKETIDALGIIGSEVQVKKGYARNFLIPYGKAVEATPQNRKILAQEKVKLDLQIAKERAQAEEMAQRIEGVVCTIKAKAADEKRLYGSMTVRDVVEALAAQNIDVPKRMVLMEPIKEIGTYPVQIRIYKNIHPEITVIVEPE